MAASTNLKLTNEEHTAKAKLSEADQAEVIAAMQHIDPDHVPTSPSAEAPAKMRWSDLNAAVYYACNRVEMAIIRTEIDEDGRLVRFHLRTVEDWPGQLTVRRVPEPDLYKAEASIGRFPQKPKRLERASALLKALDEYMLAFGKKRRLDD